MRRLKAITVQVTYRKGRPFAAYIGLDRHAGDKGARSVALSPDLVVDFAADGRALGIEVVTPEAVELERILEIFDELGLERPTPSELAPLRAA